MEAIHTFTSRRKLLTYLKDVWPGLVAYAVLDGETFWVRDHYRDGRIIASEYSPYNVYKLPSSAQIVLTHTEAEALAAQQKKAVA